MYGDFMQRRPMDPQIASHVCQEIRREMSLPARQIGFDRGPYRDGRLYAGVGLLDLRIGPEIDFRKRRSRPPSRFLGVERFGRAERQSPLFGPDPILRKPSALAPI